MLSIFEVNDLISNHIIVYNFYIPKVIYFV